jgi:hypothetical protein
MIINYNKMYHFVIVYNHFSVPSQLQVQERAGWIICTEAHATQCQLDKQMGWDATSSKKAYKYL